MKNIIVNATALKSGGALTILKQFISSITDGNKYIIFIDSSVNLDIDKSNVQLIETYNNSAVKRLYWDYFGLKKWLDNNKVKVDIAISLQNTNFRVGEKIPNYIYYHQPIPFYNNKWSFFKKKERSLFLYRYIYPLFVKSLINPRTEFFVQLEYIKNGFCKRFKIDEKRVHVVFPNVTLPIINENSKIDLSNEKINLFYPATSIFYKNHNIIFKALSLLPKDKYTLYLTCKEDEFDENLIKDIDIKFLGSIPFEKVISYYVSSDALLFPSYIETFGLPLIEAAFCGLPIIASDLPYSREVLNGYNGVEYIDYNNPKLWADAISKLEKNKKYLPFQLPQKASWKEMFDIIEK